MYSKFFGLEDQLWNKQDEFESRILGYSPELLLMEWHFFQAGYVIPTHSHYHAQMTSVVHGSVAVALADGSDRKLSAGETVFFAPNEEHTIVVLEPDTIVTDIFNPVRLDHLANHKKLSELMAELEAEARKEMPLNESKPQTADGTDASGAAAANADAAQTEDDLDGVFGDEAAADEKLREMMEMLSGDSGMFGGLGGSVGGMLSEYGDDAQEAWSDELVMLYSALRGGQRAIFDALSEQELPEGQGFNETTLEQWNAQLAVPMTEETFRALQLFEREQRKAK